LEVQQLVVVVVEQLLVSLFQYFGQGQKNKKDYRQRQFSSLLNPTCIVPAG